MNELPRTIQVIIVLGMVFTITGLKIATDRGGIMEIIATFMLTFYAAYGCLVIFKNMYTTYRVKVSAMSTPDPPIDVKAIMFDMTSIPLDMAYKGINDKGLHVWVNTNMLPERPASITMDTLPPKTSISILWDRNSCD